jgi:hypothetical protein
MNANVKPIASGELVSNDPGDASFRRACLDASPFIDDEAKEWRLLAEMLALALKARQERKFEQAKVQLKIMRNICDKLADKL